MCFDCKVYCVRDDGLTSYLGFTDSVLLLQLLWKKIVLIRRGREEWGWGPLRVIFLLSVVICVHCTSLDLRRIEWIFWPVACEPG